MPGLARVDCLGAVGAMATRTWLFYLLALAPGLALGAVAIRRLRRLNAPRRAIWDDLIARQAFLIHAVKCAIALSGQEEGGCRSHPRSGALSGS